MFDQQFAPVQDYLSVLLGSYTAGFAETQGSGQDGLDASNPLIGLFAQADVQPEDKRNWFNPTYLVGRTLPASKLWSARASYFIFSLTGKSSLGPETTQNSYPDGTLQASIPLQTMSFKILAVLLGKLVAFLDSSRKGMEVLQFGEY